MKVYQSLVGSFNLQIMSQLGTELIPHSITDKGISLTLMYSKTSQQILFVEAGKDFVDLVVGFLTLPIGCVIKLLSESEHFFMDPTKCHRNSPSLQILGCIHIATMSVLQNPQEIRSSSFLRA